MKNNPSLRLCLYTFLVWVAVHIPSAYSQELPAAVRNLLKEQSGVEYGNAAAESYILSSANVSPAGGVSYYYLQQTWKGIPVFNAICPVAVSGAKAYALRSPFVDKLSARVNSDQPSIPAVQALTAALTHLELPFTAPVQPVRVRNKGQYQEFDLPALLSSPAKADLVYVLTEKGVKLAWNINLDLKTGQHWWNVRIDAQNGQYIEKNDWVVSCSFDAPHDHSVHTEVEAMVPVPQPMPGSGTAQYNVFPLPVESPIHGSRLLLNDPSEPLPSPYGWHDTNGASGAEYNSTRGNNVYAYEDADNNNLPGFSPDGGSLQVFNYPFSIDSSTTYNRNASITNLFYMNNMMHDVLYSAGFNEAAGNFQENNYGNGGLGNDYVNAEALDGGGTNNANFATPDDGSNPRMQMYLWNGGSQTNCTFLNVNAPAAISGLKSIALASYNPNQAFNITANLVLVQDGVGTSSDGCSALTNAAAVAGKIAVVDRGTCSFYIKTQFAQQAGAVAVIIANNVSGSTPPAMSGTPTLPITIPTVSVTQADGNAIKTQLAVPATVNATLSICLPPPPRDGSFDNGIIAHEYGHGVSNRLTGGPAASSCLANAEQGGEGWSDWLALITTIEPGDSGAMPRGIGTFAVYQPVTGLGIRRYPYSTNMSINPQTYADLGSSTGPHPRGEIWCDAIWDMTWFLIRDFGFNPNLYTGTAGNNIALRLVLEGMKLQPCSPGYIDARNAILLADDILYGSAHRCQIWEAFARRGMGYNAAQGSSGAVGDETVDFTYPPFCLTPTAPPVADFNATQTTASCPASIQFNDASTSTPQSWLWNFGDGQTSSQQNPTHVYAQPGTYTVKLRVSNTLGADSVQKAGYITVNSFTLNVTAAPSPLCAGDSVQLSVVPAGNNAISGYVQTAIPYAPQSFTGTAVSLGDDAVSAALAIGFSFNYYGNVYTNFYISSNGFIGFSPAMTNGCCTGQLLPSGSAPNNLIAFAWNDLNPSANASAISYATLGSPPNRVLAVRYSTNHYNGTAYPMRGQVLLYEGSNAVEIHSEVVTQVPGQVTTQGMENLNGTSAVFTSGRNAAVFGLSNDAVRFSPFTNYSYNWIPATGLNGITTATPKAKPAFDQNYQVVVTAPNGCTATAPLSVDVVLCASAATVNLKAYIQGYMNGPATMSALLFNNGLSSDPQACDSLTVELRSPANPSLVQFSSSTLLSTGGVATASFPPAVYGNTYYLVVRSRNGIETWSKWPVQLGAVSVFDMTAP